MGRMGNKVVFVWGALPGELVEVEITKDKKSFAEGIVTEIIESSPERIAPREDHYLSCSPWQIMSLKAEEEWKKKIVAEVYQKFADVNLGDVDFANSSHEYSYRNKIEFGFCEGENDKVQLSVYERDSHEKVAITECLLAREPLNKVAVRILDWINKSNLHLEELNSLVVRCNQANQVVAGLFLSNKVEIGVGPEMDKTFIGFAVYLGTLKNDFSGGRKIFQLGNGYLKENILKTELEFGLLSFMQINVATFELALLDIKKWLKRDDKVIDYYCGAGAISIPLSNNFASAQLVEINAEAADLAVKNIAKNKIKNCEVFGRDAERAIEFISAGSTIILDPPRAGVGNMVISAILKNLPKKIIYLSCDTTTQARDIKKLLGEYTLEFVKIYNFFPRTPHIETLAVLVKRVKH